jgi:hypothetical protein
MAIQPVGSIVAYPGAIAPKGWLLCDGKPIPAGSTFDELRKLTGANTPDFQGYFLRGIDFNGKIDPNRKMLDSQSDSVGPHTHGYSRGYIGPAGLSGSDAPNVLASIDHPQSDQPTPPSTETRPKNKAINFIIKAIDEG